MELIIYLDAPPLFPLGEVVATHGAVDQISQMEMAAALARHQNGEWGDMCDEDQLANERALREGGRLFSAYHTADRTKFWIITEADRSATTVLLPDEY